MTTQKTFVSTTANTASGESIEMIQLAEVMGAEITTGVPAQGLLVYIVNINIRRGTEDLQALAERKFQRTGVNVLVVGTCRGWEETEVWRPYFNVVKQVADVVFVHHTAQVEYLRQYGIEAVLKPINERRRVGEVEYQPKSVVYTGFLWEEKDLQSFIETALLLPDWRFTIHVGNELKTESKLPDNCELHGKFVLQESYLEYLAGFEYVWIPRKRTRWVYAGRSGLSAVASGRPAILTDVPPNDVVPPDVAIKYPPETPPEEIAALIASRPVPDPAAVDRFLESISPEAVWEQIQQELQNRGLI